ncbi:hypothetical protein LR48_Vigan07g135200 [Vigna angularis]|uniref:Uncharacterized protein n=1 Tax=Phaseolus angularis TaxID=3914 RepID=A0A0L9UXZ2_PHAAN|nr:hypothetical protein LR48_Vigan07g135200 [Vigna angularis]
MVQQIGGGVSARSWMQQPPRRRSPHPTLLLQMGEAAAGPTITRRWNQPLVDWRREANKHWRCSSHSRFSIPFQQAVQLRPDVHASSHLHQFNRSSNHGPAWESSRLEQPSNNVQVQQLSLKKKFSHHREEVRSTSVLHQQPHMEARR